MNDGRLILILDTQPNKESAQALKNFWTQFKAADKPTFAMGLLPDITLSLSSKYPQHIYNAFEFIPLGDETIWNSLNVNEVYTLLKGCIWPKTPITQAKESTQYLKTDCLYASA